MKHGAILSSLKKAVKFILSKSEITERYPDSIAKKVLPKRFRGYVSVDLERCTLCKKCEKNCPSQAIQVKVKEAVISIDYSKCLFCGYCVQNCADNAILFSDKFEGAGNTKNVFIHTFNILRY